MRYPWPCVFYTLTILNCEVERMNKHSALNVSGFCRFLLARMRENRIQQVAGSLTFTTMLAMVPLLTIALIVISAMPVFADYGMRFKLMLLSTLVPEFAGKILTVYVRQFADNAEKLTAAGILILAATTLMLMSTIERTFSAIWGVSRARPWLRQAMIYWIMLTLGPAVLGGGLLLWHKLFKASRLIHTAPLLAGLLQHAGAVILTALVLSILYWVIPERHVPRRHALLGGLLTALLLEVAKWGFAIYIDAIASYKLVYGAFASIPIVLLWVFCMWLVVLSGAVFTCSLSYWNSAAWQRRHDARRRLLDGLQLLLLLEEAHVAGTALSTRSVRSRIAVGYDELGLILECMARRGWVQKGENGCWVLMKSLEGISLLAVFQLFVYPHGHAQHNLLEKTFDHLMHPLLGRLAGVSVADFAQMLQQKAEPIPIL